MNRLILAVEKIDATFHAIAGLALAFMMAVTLLDVVMRNIGRPIVGTVEIISFSGSIVFGFAIPYTSWRKAHVYVDLVVIKLRPRNRVILAALTRCMGIALFAFLGYHFIAYGLDLIRTGEVSASFRIPYHPIAFGLSLSCFLQSITLFCDLVRTIKGADK